MLRPPDGRRPDGTAVDGWGECAALADTTYDREDVARRGRRLAEDLVPRCSVLLADGCSSPPSVGWRSSPTRPVARLACSAMEMAVGDACTCGRPGRRSPRLLGVAGRRHRARCRPRAPRPRVESARADITRAWPTRVCPGEGEGGARHRTGDRPGAGGWTVERALPSRSTPTGPSAPTPRPVGRPRRPGSACIEQPLARDDLAGHRPWPPSLTTPICLDESLDSAARVVEAVELGACSVVCVKPARLGGIGAALDVIDWCAAERDLVDRAGCSSRARPGVDGQPGRAPGPARCPATWRPRRRIWSTTWSDRCGSGGNRSPGVSGNLVLPVRAGPAPGRRPTPWSDRRVGRSGHAGRRTPEASPVDRWRFLGFRPQFR